jgi:heterodisulfide reductase subunit A-like polyferredoxin
LINIREQCAWTHSHDPEAATAKATAMIAGAAAWAMATPRELNKRKFVNQSALVIGNNRIAEICAAAIRALNTESYQIKAVPSEIKRCNGHYIVTENNHTWKASALVLAPNDDKEGQRMLDTLSLKEIQGKRRITWYKLDSYRTGIFKIDPDSDPELSAAAAATRITAWLNSVTNEIRPASMVNPSRCRTCGTCVEICEFGAPMLVKTQGRHSSWIDPVYCRGCGICAAHCPSGAITPGYSTDSQMDAMLSAILAHPT